MNDLKEQLRTCPYSGKQFYPTRQNQRFANPEYRIAYHNNANNELRKARYYVDNKLHKNYSIFLELMKGKNQENFHKEFLKGKGVSLNVMTHYVMYEGVKRPAIYDFIIISDNTQVTVIRIKR